MFFPPKQIWSSCSLRFCREFLTCRLWTSRWTSHCNRFPERLGQSQPPTSNLNPSGPQGEQLTALGEHLTWLGSSKLSARKTPLEGWSHKMYLLPIETPVLPFYPGMTIPNELSPANWLEFHPGSPKWDVHPNRAGLRWMKLSRRWALTARRSVQLTQQTSNLKDMIYPLVN